MVFDLVQRQVHLAALVHARECSIVEKTSDCLARALEACDVSEGRLAGVTLPQTRVLSVLAWLTDLFSALHTVLRFNSQVAAVRTYKLCELLVLSRVEPDQLRLNVVQRAVYFVVREEKLLARRA